MKKFKLYSCAVFVCLLQGIFSVQAQCYTPTSGNIITDPECSNYPTSSSGWSKGWGNATAITGANAYCGTSVQVTGTCGGSIDYTLTGKLLPNTSYRLKCMLYSDKEAFITLNGCGINGLTSDYQITRNTGSTWQVVDFYFVTGTLASTQNFWLSSCSGSNQATDIRLDNLEIYQATEPVVTIPMEPMDSGKFVPTWESLKQYNEAPDWFQDAKFGIWAHWGPQCQPEQGDWFARFMYYPGSQQNWFTSTYGSATNLGFKEVINSWKAESWQPDSIVKLYKNAGAKYFFALGNHHDNLDLWDSKYQQWNTVNVGPKKNIIDGWEKAARANGLRFGVSIHASHAWSWYEPSQSYDGNLKASDGTGKWWDGLDPQELYAQNHAHSTGWNNSGTIHSQWNWVDGASIPSKTYCAKFYNRTMDMINKYNPDLIYFDDTSLPFVAVDDAGNRSITAVSDVGLKIAASYYNKSANANNGKVENVIFGKILNSDEKDCMVWDVERGIPDKPQAKHWQTCTCIGDWHYSRSVYDNNQYKSAITVLHMLIDIVSKNGNLLLNVPLRGNGTYDEKELAVVKGITAWMNVNKESIYDTRPWIQFGEGPTAERANALSAQGFNEGTSYDVNDIRYVKKGDSLLYVTVMGWPTNGKALLKSLATTQPYLVKNIKSVQILGGGNLTFTRNADGLSINLPATKPATANIGIAFKISLDTIVSFESLKGMIRIAEATDSVAKLNAGSNSGQYSPDAVVILEAAIVVAKANTAADSNSVISQAIATLQNAIVAFKSSSKTAGGIIDYSKTQNITNKYLKEARAFSRTGTSTVRFGQPANWNADFNIPQTDGSGTKQGIDKYPGYNTLMLGAWGEVTRSTVDATNARLYKKVTLPAGKYFFGANYNTLYQLSKGYIFASKTIPTIANVESTSIAFHSISTDAADNAMYGIEFSLLKETEVYLGWVADLTTTSNLEFRVKEIELIQVLAPTDNYVAENAVSASAGTDILLNFAEFARVYNTSGTYNSLSNTGYLVGATGGSLDLGVIDFGTNKYNKAFVNTANASTTLNAATYDLYLDDQATAFVSIPAVSTGSATSFTKSEIALGSIAGVHKVTLKFNKHTSSLFSAGFAVAGTNAVKEIKLSDIYKIYTTKNSIVIDGVTNNKIAVYSSDGTLVDFKTSVTGKVEFKVKQGVYLVEIDGKAVKVML